MAVADEEATAVLAARRAAAPAFGVAVTENLRALAMPHATVVRRRRGARRRAVPALGEPWDAAAAAEQGGVGRGTGPHDAGAAPRDAGPRRRRAAATSTLVFDEVDAGIGGAAATAVAEALAAVAAHRQVLVVTHLAQVAALADTQFAVTKAVDGRGDHGGRRDGGRRPARRRGRPHAVGRRRRRGC